VYTLFTSELAMLWVDTLDRRSLALGHGAWVRMALGKGGVYMAIANAHVYVSTPGLRPVLGGVWPPPAAARWG